MEKLFIFILVSFFSYIYASTFETVPLRNDMEIAETKLDMQNTARDGEYLPEGKDHPCYRKCEPGITMACYYRFELEWYETMSKACFNCPHTATDCDKMDCIPADGMSRPLNVVNRKLPGPSVQVCLNDEVVVDVVNSLISEGTAIHWHGHHQRNTPYMDGTPFVTQCPIAVGSTFRYKFTAEHSGTHFWHSHSGLQRTDGAYGAFIVREPKNVHADLYDYDRSEDVIIITDWIHELGVRSFIFDHHSNFTNDIPSLLVNGRGRYKNFLGDEKLFIPVAKFNVKKGYSYRFRLINSEFLNCPIEMSVDNHKMTIISSDGNDVEPVEADSLVSYAGERYDFILSANQDIDTYWIRFRGLMYCDDHHSKAHQVAVIHYEGALDREPSGNPTWEESRTDGYQINALNTGTGQKMSFSVAELSAMDPDDRSLQDVPDFKYYVAYDFYRLKSTPYHKYPYYGFNQVIHEDQRLHVTQLNHITMKLPSFPLLPGRDRIDSNQFCNASTVKNCTETYCECTHVVNIPLNAVVEVILIDEGLEFDSNHPFHLHGYAFRVVAMERISNTTSLEQIKQLDAEGKIKRNLLKAPLKDSVTVPDGGYTILRWVANNPGYWILHCHIDFHIETGMALIFKVGEHSNFPPIPKNFPQCGDYLDIN